MSSGTEAVRVLGIGVTVAALGEADALDTGVTRGAALARVISSRVTVTPGREGGLALTILGTTHHHMMTGRGLSCSPCTRLHWDRSCLDPRRRGHSHSPGADTCTGHRSGQRSRWSPRQRPQGHLKKAGAGQSSIMGQTHTHSHIRGETWEHSPRR